MGAGSATESAAASCAVAEPVAPGRPGRRLTPVRCAAALVVLLYAVAALPARSVVTSDFHRRQAAAFAEGHLDIRPVPPDLARLDDPYDPSANLELRTDEGVQDLAYVDGRLYSAHGLTVPLVLLPMQFAFGWSPPNWVMTFAFGCAGLLAGAWLLCRIRRRYLPDLPSWIDPTLVLALGLCSPVWALMGFGGGYEVAIAAAFACTMGGAALLFRATATPARVARVPAVFGSLLLGLAVGARPTMLPAVLMVLVAVAVVVRTCPDRRRWPVAAVLALVLPYVAVLGLIGWYNATRFGSVDEFGFLYQLSVWHMPRYPLARPAYVVPNVADYLAAAPRVSGSWPWVSLRGLIGGDRPALHTSEPTIGLLLSAPVVPVGLTCLAVGATSMWRQARPLAVLVGTGLAVAPGSLLAVSLPFNTSSLRYLVDAAPLLLMVSCLGWAWIRSRAEPTGTRGLDLAWVIALGSGSP